MAHQQDETQIHNAAGNVGYGPCLQRGGRKSEYSQYTKSKVTDVVAETS